MLRAMHFLPQQAHGFGRLKADDRADELSKDPHPPLRFLAQGRNFFRLRLLLFDSRASHTLGCLHFLVAMEGGTTRCELDALPPTHRVKNEDSFSIAHVT